MKEVVRRPGRSRESTSYINNSGRTDEINRVGLRFSSNSQVAEIREKFGLLPKPLK